MPAKAYIPHGMLGYKDFDFIDTNSTTRIDTDLLKGHKIKIGVSHGVDEYRNIISYFKKVFKSEEIDADFFINDVGKILRDFRQNKLDIILVSNYYTYPDSYSILQLFESDNIFNITGYRNYEIDNLLNKSIYEPDKEKRADIYIKINEIIYKDLVTINLFYGATQTGLFKKGWIIPKLNYLGELFMKYKNIKQDYE
jgi:ABC-type transport system substrate-binding protein